MKKTDSAPAALLQWAKKVLDSRALGRAILALAPPLALTFISGKAEWLAVAIVPIAMLIALDRSQLAPLGVLAHALTISAGFLVLMASFAHPLLFIAAVALLGGYSVLLTARGDALLALGNFTFIPSLYLACDKAEGATPTVLIFQGVNVLPWIWMAALPILILATVEHLRSRDTSLPIAEHFARWTRLPANSVCSPYFDRMIVVTLAVAGAAALVEWRHLDQGQWVIWSAASVVTGDALSARRKFFDRIVGAFLGVLVGGCAGLLLPHLLLIRALVVFVAMLTLVCVRPYRFAFGVRCACAAMALTLTGGTWMSGGQRLLNVVVGSTIGLLCMLTASALVPRRA